MHTVYGGDIFQSMFNRGKGIQTFGHSLGSCPDFGASGYGGHCIEQVVSAACSDACHGNVHTADAIVYHPVAGLNGGGMTIGKGAQACADAHAGDARSNYGVVRPIDCQIRRPEVLEHAQLGRDIVLHFVVITIQMVGRDIEQHGHIGVKGVHIVQLKRGQLDDVYSMRLIGYKTGQTHAYIAAGRSIVSAAAQQMRGQHRGGGLAVAAGYCDKACTGGQKKVCKFNFANHGNTLGDSVFNYRCIIGYAGTFDDNIRSKYTFDTVLSLLIGDACAL